MEATRRSLESLLRNIVNEEHLSCGCAWAETEGGESTPELDVSYLLLNASSITPRENV